MKYLIIPDIHLKHQWAEGLIGKEKPDKTIFLGDYFDNFNESFQYNTESTAVWLKSSIYKKDRIHLFGNHDIYYAYNSKSSRHAGFSDLKNFIIQSILKDKDWDRIKWFYIIEETDRPIIFTHAGLSNHILLDDSPEEYLNGNDKIARKRLKQSQYHDFWRFGPYHGGNNLCGGITWCRPFNGEFVGISGYDQLFGHTFQGKNEFGDFSLDDSKNFCLDGAQTTYAVVENGKIEIKNGN